MAYAALKRPEALSVSWGQSPIISSNYIASIISESNGTKIPAALKPRSEIPTKVSVLLLSGNPKRWLGPKQKRAIEARMNEIYVRYLLLI